jgi:hypothetical protein
MYNDTPTQNQEVTISLMTDESVGEVDWVVVSQPDSANLALAESEDTKSITFTAAEPGEYEIVARSSSNGSEKSTSFSINTVFPFDDLKVGGNDGSAEIESITGVVTNQSWINSSTLSRMELETIVAEFSALTVVGYDETLGLLVEYDEAEISNIESLEEIKTRSGVDSVRNRYHRGEDSIELDQITPNDSTFGDGGDNWHLEYIGTPEAWEYTTGSEDIVVGVSEAAFDIQHDELSGRFNKIVSGSQNASAGKKSHGNASAGSIGAVTNNKAGMSGINWISPMSLGRWDMSGLKNILSDDAVVTINSSWSWPIPVAFDPDNSGSANTRRKDSIDRFQDFRELVDDYPNVLFVWSAGNGIGRNGEGNSKGVYGTNSYFANGAIHYNDNESIGRKDNVIVVAAMRDDQRLAYYSNYGVSVDLAAPTAYKSLSIGNKFKENSPGKTYGEDGGYTGTSASAPVVTGVASLVYSLYPGFTGKEVKEILIDSATAKTVSKRYIAPGGAGQNNSNIAPLLHKIPIINASEALKNAQEIIDSKVKVTHTFPDPFTPQSRILFESIDENLEVVGIDWKLESSTDGGSSWTYINAMSINGDLAEPMLDTSTPYHRITASTVILRDPDNGNKTTATNKEYQFSYAPVIVTAKDTVSLNPLPIVEVGLELIGGLPKIATGFTDDSGAVSAYLKPGTYKVRGNLTGYQEAVTSVTVYEFQSLQATLNMASDSIGAVGSLSGQVFDANGEPVVGASVRISGGASTNGFFASATTDIDGNYIISNISKTDSVGKSIDAFILEASAFGFASSVKEEVIVLPGKERIENFTLTTQNLTGSTVFADDFEQEVNGWSATGFWNQMDFGNNTVANTLVDDGHTSLAPDETGPQALLPDAFSGDFAWWYGQADTGTFIGTQSELDYSLSGGQSTSLNSGQLTSPSISLVSASFPLLKFRTWWEIESVNPNQNGFDVMELQISTDGGFFYETIKKFNPFVDPNDLERDSKPFSSGGYNRKPVWVIEEIDLSKYLGEVVTLRFSFNTNDEYYNGFRGWIVDDIEVVDYPSTEISAFISVKSLVAKPSESNNKLPVHIDTASEEFLNVHKKPRAYELEGFPSRE